VRREGAVAGTPLWAWAVTVGLIITLLAAGFVVAGRRPHAVGRPRPRGGRCPNISVAVMFGLVLRWLAGSATRAEYFAVWVVEKSLSVDNLFVFLIIMGPLRCPRPVPAEGAAVRHHGRAGDAGDIHRRWRGGD